MKTKIILKSNTIVFDPFNLFVFVNICLLVLFKKFNMDITEKMVSFQIIQNVINVKTTLEFSYLSFDTSLSSELTITTTFSRKME